MLYRFLLTINVLQRLAFTSTKFNVLLYNKQAKKICSGLDKENAAFKRALLNLQIKEVEEIFDNVKIERRKLAEYCLALLNLFLG